MIIKTKNKNKFIKNQSKTFSLKHHQYYDLQNANYVTYTQFKNKNSPKYPSIEMYN